MTPAEGLRRGLIALSGLGIAGTLVELAILRHWNSPAELAPWLFLTIGGTSVLLLALRPNRRIVIWARWTGLFLAAAGMFGLAVHVLANMEAAPLDGTVGATWESLSIWRQVWLASTGGVGPAPPLAAASIAPTGLSLALATFGHEALGTEPSSRLHARGDWRMPGSTRAATRRKQEAGSWQQRHS